MKFNDVEQAVAAAKRLAQRTNADQEVWLVQLDTAHYLVVPFGESTALRELSVAEFRMLVTPDGAEVVE